MNSSVRVGTLLDGKYELTALLGKGGMGAVYLARHNLIKRKLAVKFLHPQYADNEEVVIRFQHEAQAAARIGHENIIEITDMGTAEDGSPYIVMEYLEGTDVRGLIDHEGILSVERTANIMVQALSGLQAAHNAGIIHRDLKPENIYLAYKNSNPDYVKLLDFGISKFKEFETNEATALTQTGTVLGTPHYMSPEQARGAQNMTLRSDIYSMGVILYQMLTGELPYDAPNYNSLLIKIFTEEPCPPEELNPNLPEHLVQTIKTAMARDAADRFKSCDEFRAHLVPYVPTLADDTGNMNFPLATQPVMSSTNAGSPTPLQMTQSGISSQISNKSKLPIIISAAVAVVILAILEIVFASGSKHEPPKVAAPAKVNASSSVEIEQIQNDVDEGEQQPTEAGQPSADKPFVVVAASIKQSFSNGRKRAEKKAEQLRNAGFESTLVLDGPAYPNFRCCFWVVVVDSFANFKDANVLKTKVSNAGFDSYVKNAFKR